MSSLSMQNQIREDSLATADFLADLHKWTDEIKHKDEALRGGRVDVHGAAPSATRPDSSASPPSPPIRGHVVAPVKMEDDELQTSRRGGGGSGASVVKPAAKKKAKVSSPIAAPPPKNAAGHTYEHFKDKWDKFDLEGALRIADEDTAAADDDDENNNDTTDVMDTDTHNTSVEMLPAARSSASASASASGDPTMAAEKAKTDGNARFTSGDYTGAAVLYSLSIRHHPTAAAFANRAMCRIKLQVSNATINTNINTNTNTVDALNSPPLCHFQTSCADVDRR